MKSPIANLLITTSIFIIMVSCVNNTASVPIQVKQQVPSDTLKVKNTDTLSITAVGDIMIGSAYPSKSNLPPDDGINSFKAVDRFLNGGIVFGNLEGCF